PRLLFHPRQITYTSVRTFRLFQRSSVNWQRFSLGLLRSSIMRWLALPILLVVSVAALAQTPADAPEHLSPYGLAKPVLIVAVELPEDFDNKDGIAVLKARADAPPAGFQFMKNIDDAPTAGKVGIYVPPKAILRIKGRTMSNVGEGDVTL